MGKTIILLILDILCAVTCALCAIKADTTLSQTLYTFCTSCWGICMGLNIATLMNKYYCD